MKRDNKAFLPASICYEASLPKNFTKDSRAMKDLQGYKMTDPEDRYSRIARLIPKFEKSHIFDEWGIKINQNFAQVKVKQLYHPMVLDNKNQQRNWEDYGNRKIPHSQPLNLDTERWALVYGKRDFDNANMLLSNL